MKQLIKDSEGNIHELEAVKGGFIPPGYELISEEELEAAQATVDAAKLSDARIRKLDAVRAAREPKLKRVDVLSNIAYLNSWTAGEKTELKNYRLALLDITEAYKADPSLLDDLDVAAIVWPDEPSES